ncbi:MAG: ABC transporter permease, partial [Agromyces sp.]
RHLWRILWRALLADKLALAALVFLVLLVLAAIFAPVVSPYDPESGGLMLRNKPPLTPNPDGGFPHLLGTDQLGRDVLVRLAYGAQVSLLVGVLASIVASVIGIAIGTIAGFSGGVVDTVLSRTMDLVMSVPFLLCAIALVSVLGPSLSLSIAVIVFFSWTGLARVIRGQVLALRHREFVEAARSLGATRASIMFRDILPNLVVPIIVYTTLMIPAAIVFEATLSFLGLGIVPPTPSWGNMLADAANGSLYLVAWWMVVVPGGALLALTLAFNLLGDGLRDALDPAAVSKGKRA